MTKRQRKNLTRIIVSAVLIVCALFENGNVLVQKMLFLCAYAVTGYDVLLSAIRKMFSCQLFDEEILMSVATAGAILLQEYPEAAMVMTLYQTGELFQSIAVGKSRKSIKELMKIKPDRATVIRDGREETISPENVNVGETVLVLPGEKVPLDGIITGGESNFDSSSLTGESMPLLLQNGGRAISGMINLESPVMIQVESTYKESTVSKILELVENSSAYKSPAEKFITKFSRRYTPIVFAAAVAVAVVPTLLFGQDIFRWIRRALIFLIVSCPCALVISVPLTFFGAIGAASRKGILIKGSEYIETMSKVSLVAFDKTGTLTHGRFSVTQIKAFKIDENELLEIAAHIESFSNHPIGQSIVAEYDGEIKKERVRDIKIIAGKGICATVDGKKVFAGNKELLVENGFDIPWIENSGTTVYIACDKCRVGYIVLEDKIKENAQQSLKQLRRFGVKKCVMLTGDEKNIAEKIGDAAGVDEVYSQLLPQDKVEEFVKLKTGEISAYVGDGINDAPVLSCADVGIAMGAMGADAAIEAADIVIMNDSLSAICETANLSRKTMRIVRENIALSLVVKFLVMALSLVGFDNMYAAIFADVGIMVIAVLNAMRVGYKVNKQKRVVA